MKTVPIIAPGLDPTERHREHREILRQLREKYASQMARSSWPEKFLLWCQMRREADQILAHRLRART